MEPRIIPARASDLFFCAALLSIMLGMKAVLNMLEAAERSGYMYRIENTQRKRYIILATCLTISFILPAWIVVRYGARTFWLASAEWLDLEGWYGKFFGGIVCLGAWFGLLAPIIGALAARYIYRHPCLLAKRVKGGWVLTQDIRSKRSPVFVVSPHRFDHRKEYLPTNQIYRQGT